MEPLGDDSARAGVIPQDPGFCTSRCSHRPRAAPGASWLPRSSPVNLQIWFNFDTYFWQCAARGVGGAGTPCTGAVPEPCCGLQPLIRSRLQGSSDAERLQRWHPALCHHPARGTVPTCLPPSPPKSPFKTMPGPAQHPACGVIRGGDRCGSTTSCRLTATGIHPGMHRDVHRDLHCHGQATCQHQDTHRHCQGQAAGQHWDAHWDSHRYAHRDAQWDSHWDAHWDSHWDAHPHGQAAHPHWDAHAHPPGQATHRHGHAAPGRELGHGDNQPGAVTTLH